jgi:hypothetical protein
MHNLLFDLKCNLIDDHAGHKFFDRRVRFGDLNVEIIGYLTKSRVGDESYFKSSKHNEADDSAVARVNARINPQILAHQPGSKVSK